MRLEDEQYEYIKQTVADTYVQFDIKCTPISAFELAVKMGIRLIAYSSLLPDKKKAVKQISLDGCYIESNSNTWTIYYNDEDNNYERINNTIMHEIGHHVLGHIHEGGEEEAEANFFAKYALAPPPLVHKLSVINPSSIKQAFDISWEAACYAYDYYRNWLKHRKNEYADYEIRLLQLFEVA